MAIYFFHVRDGPPAPDDSEIELPNLEAARLHAAHLAGVLMADNAALFWRSADWTIEAMDEKGLILFSLLIPATESPALGFY